MAPLPVAPAPATRVIVDMERRNAELVAEVGVKLFLLKYLIEKILKRIRNWDGSEVYSRSIINR